MDGLLNELEELNIGKVKRNELLSQHTTMKIGGPADLLLNHLQLRISGK